jgi:hypothetical protein
MSLSQLRENQTTLVVYIVSQSVCAAVHCLTMPVHTIHVDGLKPRVFTSARKVSSLLGLYGHARYDNLASRRFVYLTADEFQNVDWLAVTSAELTVGGCYA